MLAACGGDSDEPQNCDALQAAVEMQTHDSCSIEIEPGDRLLGDCLMKYDAICPQASCPQGWPLSCDGDVCMYGDPLVCSYDGASATYQQTQVIDGQRGLIIASGLSLTSCTFRPCQ